MAKERKKNTQVKAARPQGQVVVNQIDLRQIVRQSLDINRWRQAIQAAENIQNPQRRQLYEIYADIVLDAHLTSCIEKRKSEICNLDIVFSRDGVPVDEINRLIAAPWFERLIRDLLDTRFWGFTAVEFLQFEDENIDYRLIDRRYVKPELGLIVQNMTDATGWEYADPKLAPWILTAGDTRDLGLLVKAAPYALYKRNALGDFAQFCEQFGQPIRVAKYNPYDENTRQTLQKVMDSTGSALAITIPQGVDLQLIQTGNATGSKDLYNALIDACDQQISKLFLHETLTTQQGDNGARSLGEVHERVADAVHAADRRFILNLLNYELRWRLAERGYPADGGEFTFAEHTEIDLEKQARIDETLDRLGVPLDDDYYYETYGRPKPADYEALKGEKAAQKAAAAFPFGGMPPQESEGENGSEGNDSLDDTDPNSDKPEKPEDPPKAYARPGVWARMWLPVRDFFRHAPTRWGR